MVKRAIDRIAAYLLILLLFAGCSSEPTRPTGGGCLVGEDVYDHVVINEILAHSDLPYEDALELYNPSSEAICLGGWFLSDDDDELQKYQIPNGKRIGAGEYLIIYAQQFNAKSGEAGSFGLSEYGEDIYLTAADEQGELMGYQDHGSFPASTTNQSLGRHEASDGIVFVNLQGPPFGVKNPGSVAEFRQSSGADNADILVGPIVISEILYDPAEDESEYLALTNISEQSVALHHPVHSTFTWQFTDGIQYEFPPKMNIAPGEIVYVVEIDPMTFRSNNDIPASATVLGPYEGRLKNEGERLTLSRPDQIDLEEGYLPYVVIDSLAYGTAAPWPTVSAGSGTPIVRLDLAASGDDAANWQAGDGIID